MTRKYEQRQRAEGQAETRRRIVEATVGLHETVGPARTTISAIADVAQVQRLTVYRHFADERALFQACSAHWAAANPPPDPADWAALTDPLERLQLALREIYAFFRATEAMLANLLRDLPESPALQETAEPFLQYWETVRVTLDRGWPTRGKRRALTRAAIGHAIEFDTWRSLVRQQGLDDRAAADLMVELARATSGGAL
jgi:AcrR family transcriptional regulator